MEGHAEAVIDLAAVTANVQALRAHTRDRAVMAVVKSDGYGHGMIPAARAALAGGADWLAVVRAEEALALRAAGLTAPVLCLMSAAGVGYEDVIRAGVDLSVSTVAMVRQLAAAAAAAGQPASLHLKADTGMSRGGATLADWPDLVAAARSAEAAGQVRITGVWSHLACADIPGHPSIAAQVAAFAEAIAIAEKAGARPQVRHLANTPATVTVPQTWFDMVRPGGGIFGLATLPGGPPPWLRPAMTVRARLVQVKRVAAGTGVSYGHRYRTSGPATLGLVPLGYAEGVPRAASSVAEVLAAGRRRRIAGTVCMNQFVLDFGDDPVAEGDEVVLFGPGDEGEPTAQEWADVMGTLSYDIVTRFAARVPRSYRGVACGEDPVRAGAAAEMPGTVKASSA